MLRKNFSRFTSLTTLFLLAMTAVSASAQNTSDNDGAYLDPPYKRTQSLVTREALSARGLLKPLSERATPLRSDILGLIALQTPVRAQGARGTCSIFSAIGLLEGLLVQHRGADTRELDLSEEWLEYVKVVENGGEGSTSPANINLLRRFGTPHELAWDYLGETWDAPEFSLLANERCGYLKGNIQKKCLIGHRNPKLLKASNEELNTEGSATFDPAFFEIRNEAKLFWTEQNLEQSATYRYIWSEDAVKELLLDGVPVLLDIDFYYGAWNHRVAPDLGIERNLAHWALGIVGFPEAGSVDRKNSKKDPAGHSVLLVGFDDQEEISISTKMLDGSTQTFVYKGVYYFKNSWGTGKFGADFELEGHKLPGYGKITQRYSHEYGSFYAWDWRNKFGQ